MVDEVSDYISRKGDGNAGRQKFMAMNNTRAQVRKSFKDNHSRVLGVTAANGHLTMCATIIDTSNFKVTDVTRFNPLSSDGQDICGEEIKVLEEDIHAMKDQHSN
jgi:hypothetical protein